MKRNNNELYVPSTNWGLESTIDRTCDCKFGFIVPKCKCYISRYFTKGPQQYHMDELNDRWTRRPETKLVVKTGLALFGIRNIRGMRRTSDGAEYLIQWDQTAM